MDYHSQEEAIHAQAVRELVVHYCGMWPRSQTSGVVFWRGEKVSMQEFAAMAGGIKFFDDTEN